MLHWPSNPAPMSSLSTACRVARLRRRTYLSNTSVFQRCRPCAWPSRRCRNSACIVRFSSLCPARIRSGADAAKALALGADAVSLGSAAMVAMGCNRNVFVEDYEALGTAPGYCHHCHTGRCPVGITTQDAELEERLQPEQGAQWLRNYLTTMVLEIQTLARACGKTHVLNLEPEDLTALTIEAAAMAKVPLAGTNWIPGNNK